MTPLPETALPGAEERDKPSAARMQSHCVPQPLALVIFGATGDLTRRMLLPAVYRLFRQDLLPECFALVGVARDRQTDEEFRAKALASMEEFGHAPEDEATWARFAERLRYVGGEFDDPATFRRLHDCMAEVDGERSTEGNRLYYLAIPPSLMPTVAEQLGRGGLVAPAGDARWTRIVVEKPFGRDLQSAREMNATLHKVFDESQIYRIDHYLGKETVQNLMVFRFANVIWEPVWNRTYVDHVQITVSETVGVERRAGYYETSGALRDMVQSHLLQLLTLVAMEPPAAYDADSIRNEKVKVLHSILPIRGPEQVARETVRGQYVHSVEGAKEMPGYRDEADVAPDSRTETFAALRLCVDNWRWAGVPFYLRTGKRLPAKVSEVVVRFRPAPHPILDVVQGDRPSPNALVLRVQPEEGISLFFEAKVPGLSGPLQPVSMDFDYARAFGTESPEAYERLLLDSMLGDATLFARKDEVEAAWALVTPILDAWAAAGEPEPYPAGTWGPEAADRLVEADGHEWHQP
ncbi:MAG: glucose-6-phosphate 1-dehydrogenase [Gemmatimonadetes bacterium]|nr:glucose-6-phosphate 1-dehydrogenase [Gemmatimonadota bacterium]